MAVIYYSSVYLISQNGQAQAAEPASVGRDFFIQQFHRVGKESFCAVDGMMECFDISSKVCEQTYEKAFSTCANRIEIPKDINVRNSNGSTEKKLGSCIGLQFGRDHFSKRKKNLKCKTKT